MELLFIFVCLSFTFGSVVSEFIESVATISFVLLLLSFFIVKFNLEDLNLSRQQLLFRENLLLLNFLKIINFDDQILIFCSQLFQFFLNLIVSFSYDT